MPALPPSGMAAAWDDMRRIISECWPDVTVIFRVPQIEAIDWKNVIIQQKIAMEPPYVVLAWNTSQTIEIGGMTRDIWQVPCTITRIVARGSGTTTDSLEDSLTFLLQALRLENGEPNAPEHFLVLDTGASMDVTENNPVTRTFLGQQMPLQAGSLTIQILVAAL